MGDDFSWLLYTNRSAHDQDQARLMLTQIIAGTFLDMLGKQVHELCGLFMIFNNTVKQEPGLNGFEGDDKNNHINCISGECSN